MSTIETVAERQLSFPTDRTKETSTDGQPNETYKYAHLLPHISLVKYPPLTPYEHVDPGLRTEVRGVSLKDLDSDGRDQLALEVARRGLMVFRDQSDFIDQEPEAYLEWGRHFGRLHIHPTSGHPENYPEIHLVYKDAGSTFNFHHEDSITTTLWHSDVSYELQPPGLTTFFLLSQPTTGGDTLFTSQVSTLEKLSPQFVAFLRTLSAVHSGVEQANYSRSGKRGGIVRREPVEHVHPVVRRHPVTREEALYVNRQFTRHIVGLKKEESETLLKFLYDHIDRSSDLQARVKWERGTVVLWDNRVTAHSAIVDYGPSGERRHGARITPQAERPIPANETLLLPN
ncbi:hypothetical protein ID866_1377 [Astraeus odoratus]|nr:hypothetical protein ID866_1377 [Astraeus odoratus]